MDSDHRRGLDTLTEAVYVWYVHGVYYIQQYSLYVYLYILYAGRAHTSRKQHPGQQRFLAVRRLGDVALQSLGPFRAIRILQDHCHQLTVSNVRCGAGLDCTSWCGCHGTHHHFYPFGPNTPLESLHHLNRFSSRPSSLLSELHNAFLSLLASLFLLRLGLWGAFWIFDRSS